MLGSVDLGAERGIYCKGGRSSAEQWHDLVLKKLLWNLCLSVCSGCREVGCLPAEMTTRETLTLTAFCDARGRGRVCQQTTGLDSAVTLLPLPVLRCPQHRWAGSTPRDAPSLTSRYRASPERPSVECFNSRVGFLELEFERLPVGVVSISC